MKAIKVMATVDQQGQLALDTPLLINQNSRVEVTVLIPEASESDEDDEPKEMVLESLRQSLQDANVGRTRPISEFGFNASTSRLSSEYKKRSPKGACFSKLFA
ncbi:hypothetical protein K9N68_18675 [Kovacikia minuta CCNUW1]|uniref:type II toxin-antitoxin system RelN family antitoxin n=1 Tax=Kovacikia minuta TaxID=2931930 RepID=UPI001CC8EE2E|nr:hypothetical protein [Kovacikia minuta]UBF23785.1 hypothetical protein K9N68_18675 [Kovacikia minuta CCNUW1]